MHQAVKKRRAQQIKYKIIRDLLDGKTSDLTQSPALYEALNKEKMEFDQILQAVTITKNKDCNIPEGNHD